MNIPNILTLFRLCLVPLFVVVFHSEQNMHVFATLIFLLASASDVADGYIARKYNLTTRWGQLMDPLADKCMQLAVIVSLFIAGQLPVWFIVILIAKELLMIGGGAFLYSKKTYVKANLIGKINTVVLFLVMTLFLLIPDMSKALQTVLLLISAAFALLAGSGYLYLYFVHNKRFRKYTGRNKEGVEL